MSSLVKLINVMHKHGNILSKLTNHGMETNIDMNEVELLQDLDQEQILELVLDMEFEFSNTKSNS